MYTNCLADSCRKSISTVPEFDLSVSEGVEKQETNLGLWLEVTCSRTLCLENMCMMNSIARSSEVQWMVVGMNMPCLESQSTITRI